MAHAPLCKVYKGREVRCEYIPLRASVRSQAPCWNRCASASATAGQAGQQLGQSLKSLLRCGGVDALLCRLP